MGMGRRTWDEEEGGRGGEAISGCGGEMGHGTRVKVVVAYLERCL